MILNLYLLYLAAIPGIGAVFIWTVHISWTITVNMLSTCVSMFPGAIFINLFYRLLLRFPLKRYQFWLLEAILFFFIGSSTLLKGPVSIPRSHFYKFLLLALSKKVRLRLSENNSLPSLFIWRKKRFQKNLIIINKTFIDLICYLNYKISLKR